MRRFSQKNQLVTLNEINITPLLDLAFVLLIIFVITTPLLENSIDLNLPKGGEPPKQSIKPEDIKTLEVDTKGVYRINKRPATLQEISRELQHIYKSNSNLVVDIRADREGKFQYPVDLIETCRKVGIRRFHINTEPEKR
jgi:biopolymer transport protein ExbD